MTDPTDPTVAEEATLNVHQAVAYGYALGARHTASAIARQVAQTGGKIIDWDPDADEAVAYLFGVERRNSATRSQGRPATLREVAAELTQAWAEFRPQAEDLTSTW